MGKAQRRCGWPKREMVGECLLGCGQGEQGAQGTDYSRLGTCDCC